MKKTLPLLLILFSLFLIDINVANAQVSTTASDSATASSSASASNSATATASGDLELPETLPETGAHDVLFFFAVGLVLIVSGFTGLVSRERIFQEFD